MKHSRSQRELAKFPLTIGTPYGVVTLELYECANCSDHFNFRIVEAAPLLSTRQAEPFLYRLMHTLGQVAEDMWLDLPPPHVRAQITAGTYKNDKMVIVVDA